MFEEDNDSNSSQADGTADFYFVETSFYADNSLDLNENININEDNDANEDNIFLNDYDNVCLSVYFFIIMY